MTTTTSTRHDARAGRLRRLGTALVGVLVVVLFALNTLVAAVPFFSVTLAKVVVPWRPWRRRTTRVLERVAASWMRTNLRIVELFHDVRWEETGFEGIDGLGPDTGCLVVSNHQSWVDIFALQRALDGRAPFLKFFIKRQLLYMPILGQAWWALDYPFLRRYDRSKIEHAPERRRRDLETTKRVCEKARGLPTALMSFVEGTRFTIAKHRKQDSPFLHLLRPKAGGIAQAIASLGDQMHHVLDVTIFYPHPARSFWDFVCGRVRRVVVHVRELPVPRELAESSLTCPEARERFRAWLHQVWAEKDQVLDKLAAQHGVGRMPQTEGRA
jgi:1-acyl-sn-glycerol-3-phosphate acyltransferase